MDIPTVTLRQAIRYFIRNEGGPPTVAKFLKRNPWVPQAFQAAKKDKPIPLTKKQRAEFKKLRQELEAKIVSRAVD